jgi:hypothetical protein
MAVCSYFFFFLIPCPLFVFFSFSLSFSVFYFSSYLFLLLFPSFSLSTQQVFAAVASIQVLKEQNIPHDRYVIIIEASEESGSPDLPFYIELHKNDIGVGSTKEITKSKKGLYFSSNIPFFYTSNHKDDIGRKEYKS